jgi:hypothetical protein
LTHEFAPIAGGAHAPAMSPGAIPRARRAPPIDLDLENLTNDISEAGFRYGEAGGGFRG